MEMKKLLKNRALIIGLVMVLVAVILAITCSSLARYCPFEISYKRLAAPDSENWFGTDDIGRDVFSLVLYGLRVSMIVGVLAALIGLTIGVLVGSLAGYYGGFIDLVLMRITELFFIIPRFFLALLVLAIFGTGIEKIIFIIGILSWPGTARLVRAQIISIRERDYVLAATALGAKDLRIILKHILPNCMGPIIVNTTFEVARSIILESSLSFLGLGDPQTPSLGAILELSRPFIQYAWWLGLFPSLALFWISLGFNWLGDGFGDLLNPKAKELRKK